MSTSAHGSGIRRRAVVLLQAAVRWILMGALLGQAQACWAGESLEEGAATSRLPLVVGERLEFSGRWIGIPVGSGWIEVKERVPLNGVDAIRIELQGHTNEVLSTFYPIHDVIETYVEARTLQPLRFEKHQREGHYRSDEIVTFDHEKRLAHYRSLLNGSEKDIPLTEDVHDLISAFFWFRRQPVRGGETYNLTIYTDEKLFQMQVEVGPIAPLELLKRGTFACMRVEPKASFKGILVKRGRIWAYVTADERRLPLLVQATTPWGPMSAVLQRIDSPPSATNGD